MHYNTLFQERNLKKKFLGRGTAPQKTPPHLLGASIVAFSALHTSRFRRSVLCVPYFQCRLLETLTVTNVVQDKRSQWWKFTGPPNQKSWLRQCHTPREFPTVATLKKSQSVESGLFTQQYRIQKCEADAVTFISFFRLRLFCHAIL